MLSLKDFVHAVHDAITLSNSTMTSEYQRSLEEFFVVQGEDRPKRGQGKAAAETGSKGWSGATLIPKMVAMEYPVPGSDGIKVETIQVPLIALFPIQHTRISQMTVHVDVELSSPDGGVSVAFPKPAASKNGKVAATPPEPAAPVAKLEITITPDTRPEGLNSLIEGYERALRAQLG